MPPAIYVAIGLPGFIRCPVDANPPVMLVKWTKDGNPLRIEKVNQGSYSLERTVAKSFAMENENVHFVIGHAQEAPPGLSPFSYA